MSDTASLTPSRGKKRSHNDENLSPSKTNSPAKSRHAIGIASIRNFFSPASPIEGEEESEYEFDQTINSSPQKKLRLSNSITTSATVSASFITSTPKKTPKRPSIKETTNTPNKNSPARNLLEAFNALLFPHKVGPGKNLLDLFSPLHLSLNRSDSLENEKRPSVEEQDATIGDPNHHESHSVYHEESICVSESTDPTTDTTTVSATAVTIEEEEEFNPYSLIKTLPPPPPHKGPALPPKDPSDNRLTLVLDLDETLVHCATEQFGFSDYEFDVTFNGTDYHVFARRRPYLAEFFKAIAGKFEIVLFTASQQVYANKLLDMMETSTHIHHRLFRDSCAYVEGNYIKDLRVLGRDLSRVVIVDNSPTAYGYQIDNGIPIESWFDDDSDQELLKLCPFLESLRNVEDVRPLVRSMFKTFELVARA